MAHMRKVSGEEKACGIPELISSPVILMKGDFQIHSKYIVAMSEEDTTRTSGDNTTCAQDCCHTDNLTLGFIETVITALTYYES